MEDYDSEKTRLIEQNHDSYLSLILKAPNVDHYVNAVMGTKIPYPQELFYQISEEVYRRLRHTLNLLDLPYEFNNFDRLIRLIERNQ